MSRIGRKPIPLPKGVKVDISGRTVTATGTKGSVSVDIPVGIAIETNGDAINVSPGADAESGMWGLARTLVANAVDGVATGFQKRLHIVGVGFRAEAAGSKLTMYVGYSHPVVIQAPESIRFTVEPNVTTTFKGENHPTVPVLVQGVDKQIVGDIAAKVRAVRRPDPYKGKGIRYEKERVRTDKTGKTAK